MASRLKEEYVVEDCAFVRALPEKERPANGRLKASYERVPLLFIPANPLVDLSGEPLRALDEESEWKAMSKHIIASNAGFDLLKMLPATPEQLQTVMAQFRDGLIVHFSGHGAATKDRTVLLFEHENGASNPLDAREFVREIKDRATIAFLSACQSAVAEKTEFSNLARGLVKSGVPFALGMQFNLPDPFADEISGQFYNYITRGHGVLEAARQARRAVKRQHEFFVGMIALYVAHPDEAGTLTWSGAGTQTLGTFRPADVSDLPSPGSGLIGRQRELMHIGTQLLEDKKPLTVTLHGAGGIGKTALLWQALLRFAPSFELTLAIALDPLPSLESVLGRVERFLGLPSPCSNDTKEREALVRNALAGKHTLLGLDNFETLNYALNEKGSNEEKTAKSLHTFFKSLVANGVTLCVTSREVTNLPGETFEDIQGLTNESGGRLFQENVVKQKDKVYIEKTQRISELVGGHPLALRLLASTFDDQVGTSLDQYIKSLQSFLPKGRDKWTEEERHESLSASFDFTMNNLVKTNEGEKLQIALSRLSVFSAFFLDLIATPIIENRFPDLENGEQPLDMLPDARNKLHALWERGLLERVLLLEEKNSYLYRLHPTIRLFAKTKLANADTIQEIFELSMIILIHMAEEEIDKNPIMAQITSNAMSDLVAFSSSQANNDTDFMRIRVINLLKKFGLSNDALKLLGPSNEILGETDDLSGKAYALVTIAGINLERGDVDEAMKLYQEALDIYEGLGELQNKATVLNSIAGIYSTRGNLYGAMELYEDALDIYESSGDLAGKASTLNAIAGIYVTHGDLYRAMKLYQQALDIYDELGNLKGKSIVLKNVVGIINVTDGDLDAAMKLCQQAMDISESLGDLKGKASTLFVMADIYFRRGNLDETVRLCQQAFDIFEGLGDLQGKASAMHRIASIHVTRRNFDGAMKLYQQSLDIYESLGYLKGKSDILAWIAVIETQRKNFSKALSLHEESLDIANKLGDVRGKASSLAMMAEIYALQRDYRKSLKNLLAAILTTEKIGATADVQKYIGSVKLLQSIMGINDFEILWKDLTGVTLPDWLS